MEIKYIKFQDGKISSLNFQPQHCFYMVLIFGLNCSSFFLEKTCLISIMRVSSFWWQRFCNNYQFVYDACVVFVKPEYHINVRVNKPNFFQRAKSTFCMLFNLFEHKRRQSFFEYIAKNVIVQSIIMPPEKPLISFIRLLFL